MNHGLSIEECIILFMIDELKCRFRIPSMILNIKESEVEKIYHNSYIKIKDMNLIKENNAGVFKTQ